MTADPDKAADQPGPARHRPTTADAQAELAAAQAQLTASLDALRHQFTPEAAAQKGLRAAKGIFVDRHGSIRTTRVAVAGVAAVGLIVLVAVSRRRRGR